MDTSVVLPITAEMLTPVTTYLNQAVAVAAPVGIGIYALFQGVRFVPRLINAIRGRN